MNDEQRRNEFLELLGECQALLLHLCLTHSNRQPEEVKDMYQDIVCTLWECYPSFRHGCQPRTWAFRVALRTIYQHYRRRKRMPQFVELSAEMYETIADCSNDDLVGRLYQLIDRLDEADRSLLSLYVGKVSQREIADIFGTTENAINHRISRLKTLLKQMNEEDE